MTPADRHRGPVPESAWAADEEARRRGRVQMFNASRPGGLDGWTMDLEQYALVREHILGMVDDGAPDDGVLLKDVVAAAQARFARHPAFPAGRLRNYCTYTKVDLEARCLIERVPGSGPQRLRRRRDGPDRTTTRSDERDGVEAPAAGPSPP